MDIQSIPKLVATPEDIRFIKSLGLDIVSLDCETTGLNSRVDKVLGISLFLPAFGKAFYFPCNHYYINKFPNISGQIIKDLLEFLLTSSTKILFYNSEFDLDFIEDSFGIDLSLKSYDVMAQAWNQDVNVSMPSLKDSVLKEFNYAMVTFDELITTFGGISYMTPEDVKNYACEDVIFTYFLHLKYKSNPVSSQFIVDIDAVIPAIVRKIKNQGHLIDADALSERISALNAEVEKSHNQVRIYAGFPINVNSHLHINAVLVRLGLSDLLPRTPTGKISTKANNLTLLAGKHPFIDALLSYRRQFKALKIYEGLRNSLDSSNRIYTKYRTYIVPTGRMGSGSDKKGSSYVAQINIQASPKNKSLIWTLVNGHPQYYDKAVDVIGYKFVPEVIEGLPLIEGKKPNFYRDLFLPDKGQLFMSIDFVSQELIIATSLSGESVWVNAFNSGQDVHESVAKKIFGDSSYNKDIRKITKIMNFNLLYEGTWYNIYLQVNLSGIKQISKEEAQEYVKAYKEALPTLHKWKVDVISKAYRDGYVRSYFGRYRDLSKFLGSLNLRDRAFGERSSINTQVQGCAADIMRISLVRINNADISKRFNSRILSSIHDELNFSIDPNYLIEVTRVITDAMKFYIKGFPVQMNLSYEIGHNWGLTFPFKFDGNRFIPILLTDGVGKDEEHGLDDLLGLDSLDDTDVSLDDI